MAVQGKAVDLGGYYCMDKALTAKVMRTRGILKGVIDNI